MFHKNKNNSAPPVPEEPVAAADTTPDTAPAPETPPAVEETPAVANACETELAALKDRHVRLMADFDNFRKRQIRERSEMVQRANENLLEDMLPFLDTFDIALRNGNPEDPFVKGMRMAADQLAAILVKNGMTLIVASGAFDPNTHEAITHLPSAEVPEGQIVSQVRNGWMLNGRLLRAAQVVVSSGAPEAENT